MKFHLILKIFPIFVSHTFADLILAKKAMEEVVEVADAEGGFDFDSIFIVNSQARSGNPDAAAKGAISLSILQKSASVENLWWRSSNSKVREICLALRFYDFRGKIRTESLVEEIEKNCSRFKDHEAKQRLVELKKVLNKLPEYRETLKEVRSLRQR